MSDRLYLSCWIQGFNSSNMLRHYAKLLDAFPYSKLTIRPRVARVYAIEWAEPPVIEKQLQPEETSADVLETIRDFMQEDCCCEVDAEWDLWQYENSDWKLLPATVMISCLGPAFDREAGLPESDQELGDHLRIEFGLDAKFLPAPEIPGSLRMQQSNLRSLLHLVKDIERLLPLERRRLWSESGENFAELLAQAVSQFDVQ